MFRHFLRIECPGIIGGFNFYGLVLFLMYLNDLLMLFVSNCYLVYWNLIFLCSFGMDENEYPKFLNPPVSASIFASHF